MSAAPRETALTLAVPAPAPREQHEPSHWRTLTPEQLLWVELRCQPGGVSQAGMLAPGQRLRAVLEEDEASLARLGVTRAQIADILDAMDESAKLAVEGTSFGDCQLGAEKYAVEVYGWMGEQESPFAADAFLPRSSHCVKVIRVPSPKRPSATLWYGAGVSSLIRHHGFFEGPARAAPCYQKLGMDTFRIDPAAVAEFFDIQPGASYASKLAEARMVERRYLMNPLNFLMTATAGNLRYST